MKALWLSISADCGSCGCEHVSLEAPGSSSSLPTHIPRPQLTKVSRDKGTSELRESTELWAKSKNLLPGKKKDHKWDLGQHSPQFSFFLKDTVARVPANRTKLAASSPSPHPFILHTCALLPLRPQGLAEGRAYMERKLRVISFLFAYSF